MRQFVSCTVSLAVALAASSARAESAATSPVETEDTNYRGAMIATTLGSGALVAGVLALDGNMPLEAAVPILIAGELGVAFGGAVVHIAHGESARAIASIGLRSFGTFIGASIGSTAGDLEGMATGAVLGIGAAAVLETLLLTDQTRVVHREPASPRWTPIVTPARGGGGQVGIAATF